MTAAALGDRQRGEVALHLVNNGATREAVVVGLPAAVGELRLFVTDGERETEEGNRVTVSGGVARFTLPAASYVLLLSSVAEASGTGAR